MGSPNLPTFKTDNYLERKDRDSLAVFLAIMDKVYDDDCNIPKEAIKKLIEEVERRF